MTYQNQSKLSTLPLPDLFETATQYLQSVETFESPEEFERTQSITAEFIKPGGQGEQLQSLLMKHAEGKQNWLERWWLEYAYIKGRYPLPIELSCHVGLLEDYSLPKGISQTQQAARMLAYHIEWRDMLFKEQIKPQLVRGKPLCMDQYRVIFATERIPQPGMDLCKTIRPNDTVVVLVQNLFYLLELTHNGNPLSVSELELQLARILDDVAKVEKPALGAGYYTTLPRDEWAAIRSDLYADHVNRGILDSITQCSMILTLDRHSPNTVQEICALTAASAIDRWFDKIYGLIVFANCQVSAILEHTPCDAPMIANMLDRVGQKNQQENLQVSQIRPLNQHDISWPKRLQWQLTAKHYKQLDDAAARHIVREKQKWYHLLQFEKYGVKFLTNKFVSPDTFFQLAIQLAYYKLHKTGTVTYESAHTRLFYHGRTEAVRTFSKESRDFTEAMESNASLSTKFLTFKIAEKFHKKQMETAVSGKGYERHLFGLKLVHMINFPDQELPEFFQDKAYSGNSYYKLSTSNVPGDSIYGGFGNVVPDGYGICYILKRNRFDVSIVTDKTLSAKKMGNALEVSLIEMGNLLDDIGVMEKGSSKL